MVEMGTFSESFGNRRPLDSTNSCLVELSALWNLIRRQPGGRLQTAAEVEERDQGRDLPDCRFAPARVPEPLNVPVVDQTRRLRQLPGVAEQCARLRIQLVLGPRRGEFRAEMLVPGQATNCRRMEAESRRAADLPVDERRQHLALQPAHR